MDFTALNARIASVGGPELVSELGAIDTKVQTTAARMRAALASTGGDLQAAARMIAAEANQTSRAMDQIGESAVRSINEVSAASSNMGTSAARATQQASRGLEIMARTGNLTGRSLDGILASVSKLAFGFGTAGILIGALAIAGSAIVELFTKTRKELEKTQEEFDKRIEEMRRRGEGKQILGDARLEQGDVNEAKNALAALTPKIEAARVKMEALHQEVGRGSPLWKKAHNEWIDLSDQADVLGKKAEAAAKRVSEAMKAEASLRNAPADKDQLGMKTTAKRDPTSGALDKSMEKYIKEQEAYAKRFEELWRDHFDGVSKYEGLVDEDRAKLAAKATEAFVKLQKSAADEIKKWTDEAAADFDRAMDDLKRKADERSREIGSAISNGLTAGLTSLLSGKGLGDAFKKMTAALLEGLGDMAIRFGESSAAFMKFMVDIQQAIFGDNPVLGLAASLGMIALGVSLKAAGSAIGSSGSGGGGGSYSSYALAPTNGTVLVGPPSSRTSAASISARPTINVNANIIGKDDPAAQRQLLEMISRAQRRGSTLG